MIYQLIIYHLYGMFLFSNTNLWEEREGAELAWAEVAAAEQPSVVVGVLGMFTERLVVTSPVLGK